MANLFRSANTKAEVIDVETEGLWNGFLENGDPVCYLLTKKIEERTRREKKKENGEGAPPRSAD